jgi:hypothetical protein
MKIAALIAKCNRLAGCIMQSSGASGPAWSMHLFDFYHFMSLAPNLLSELVIGRPSAPDTKTDMT